MRLAGQCRITSQLYASYQLNWNGPFAFVLYILRSFKAFIDLPIQSGQVFSNRSKIVTEMDVSETKTQKRTSKTEDPLV